jgi:hypothetical protein
MTVCGDCQVARRKREAKNRYEALKHEERCIRCGAKPRASDSTRCQPCLDYAARWQADHDQDEQEATA